MKGSDIFVRCLENEGVKYVFGVPGEETEDILFSMENSTVTFVPTRHEQGAAFMANVWGRLSGKAGVCLSTLGPGATNLVTGVADANLDKAPLVAISAQADSKRIHKESHQYLNLGELFRPITKWNGTIADPGVVPEVVRKAFKIAESEKPGATHIEFLEDAAGMEVENVAPISAKRVRRPDPDNAALTEAAQLLAASSHPLIIAGNGAVRKSSSEQLFKLASKYNIPVVHTFMGQGAINDSSPQSLFTIGFGFRDIVMDAVDKADVVVTVGYDIAEYAPETWNKSNTKRIVHIDFTTAEVDSHYQPAVEIVADVAASLEALNAELAKHTNQLNPPNHSNHSNHSNHPKYFDGAWYMPVRQRIIDDIAGYALKEGEPFTVPGALNILQALMSGDDLLISDVGSHKLWIARTFSACCPNGCLISNGLASMGFALPGAVAAALYSPGRRIVAAMGDGGFMMNSQEIETAQRMKCAFTIIVFNDNDYGLISWKQQMSRGRSTGTKLGNPDFVAYAKSFGINAYRPTTLSELKNQLSEALNNKQLNLIEIPISTDVNKELIAKLKK